MIGSNLEWQEGMESLNGEELPCEEAEFEKRSAKAYCQKDIFEPGKAAVGSPSFGKQEAKP